MFKAINTFYNKEPDKALFWSFTVNKIVMEKSCVFMEIHVAWF